MGSSVVPARILRFSVFEVDLAACELRKHGLRIKLAEQPFQVLALLLEKPGEIVTRDELHSRLWQADTFVDFDHGLNNAVMRVREALGDSSETPRYVETVPRRGYRFIAQVTGSAVSIPATTESEPESRTVPTEVTSQLAEQVAGEANSEPASGRRRLSGIRLMILAAAVLVVMGLLAAAVAYYTRVKAPSDGRARNKSLVVLPIDNRSGDKDQEYFADGMTDDLIANLAKLRSLRVPHRALSMIAVCPM